MSYTYNGIPCTIKSKFDNEMLQINVSGEVLTIPTSSVKETGNRVVVIESNTKANSSAQSTQTSLLTPDTEVVTDKLNINTMTLAELASLKGIGKLSARKIDGNKPDGGYTDLEQLKSLNADLDRVEWDLIDTQICFS